MFRFFKKLFPYLAFAGFLTLLLVGFFFHGATIEKIELKISEDFKDNHAVPNLKEKILSNLHTHKGKNIWEVSLDDISQSLHKIYPYGDIQVRRSIPGKIIVFLKKSPVAFLILRDNGDLHPLSFSGEIQTPLPKGKYLDLPILRGDVFYQNVNIRKSALDFILQLPKKGLLVQKNISEIIYDKKPRGFVVFLIPGNFTLEIFLTPSASHIKNIDFVLNYLLQRQMAGRRIKARFNKKIIVNISS